MTFFEKGVYLPNGCPQREINTIFTTFLATPPTPHSIEWLYHLVQIDTKGHWTQDMGQLGDHEKSDKSEKSDRKEYFGVMRAFMRVLLFRRVFARKH